MYRRPRPASNPANITFVLIFLLLTWTPLSGIASGKITGRVTDEETGNPVSGAQVILKETGISDKTDRRGYFAILNIRPGVYTLAATAPGFLEYALTDIKVGMDQATIVTITLYRGPEMRPEMPETRRKAIRRDIFPMVTTDIPTDQIEDLPSLDIFDIIGFQAGMEGVAIRGGSLDGTLFIVDGALNRDNRTNRPHAMQSLASLESVQIAKTSFSSAYGWGGSGYINVLTREGLPDRYSGKVILRYSPPAPKNFGLSPFDPESFWHRPYLDPVVCWTGTYKGEPYEDSNGNHVWDPGETFTDLNEDGNFTVWDIYTQRQYRSFEGWNSVANRKMGDQDPTNDLTPLQAQRIYRWQHRHQGDIIKPDATVDLGLGGPLPVIGKALGNMTFFFSHRRSQDMYLNRLSQDGIFENITNLKLTADISSKTRILSTLKHSQILATNDSETGEVGYFTEPEEIARTLGREAGHLGPTRLLMPGYWAPTAIAYALGSITISHQPNPRLHMGLSAAISRTRHRTNHGDPRDTSTVVTIGNYALNEAPYSYWEAPEYSIVGLHMGIYPRSRDSSNVKTVSAAGWLQWQVDPHHEIASGFEIVSGRHQVEYGSESLALPESNWRDRWERSPTTQSGYLEDRMAWKSLAINLGLRYDRFDPGGDWYAWGENGLNPYDASFASIQYELEVEETFPKSRTEKQSYLSPRVGMAFFIPVIGKIYYSCKHAYQQPEAQALYDIRRIYNNRALKAIGDPNLRAIHTVSDELGWLITFSEQWQINLATYIIHVDDKPDWVRYENIKGNVRYDRAVNNIFEEHQGWELSLVKSSGPWLTGFINYTRLQSDWGYQDQRAYYENPASQTYYDRDYKFPVTYKEPARSNLRANLSLHTRDKFGPAILGTKPLGGWKAAFLYSWDEGEWLTWNPRHEIGIKNNIQLVDYANLDLRLSKTFRIGSSRIQFFLDVNNVLNTRHFNRYAFEDAWDYHYYMYSLHLPTKKIAQLGESYPGIPGNDQPGVVRDADVDFVPLEYIPSIDHLPDKPLSLYRELYFYIADTETYMEFNRATGGWHEADLSQIDEILETRAYIDMPNLTSFTFLNPRDIHFGIRIDF